MIVRLLLLVALVAAVLRVVRSLRASLPSPTPGASAWDPWAVLGVPRSATREQVVHAYREQLKKYHPDRVADLGADLQRVAHQKTIDLQRAYRELAG